MSDRSIQTSTDRYLCLSGSLWGPGWDRLRLLIMLKPRYSRQSLFNYVLSVHQEFEMNDGDE